MPPVEQNEESKQLVKARWSLEHGGKAVCSCMTLNMISGSGSLAMSVYHSTGRECTVTTWKFVPEEGRLKDT